MTKSVEQLQAELAALEPQSTHQAAQLAAHRHSYAEDPEELQELCNLALHPITAEERKVLRHDWEDELKFEETVVMVRRMLYRVEHPEKFIKKAPPVNINGDGRPEASKSE